MTAHINLAARALAANLIVASSSKPKIRVGGWKKPRNDSVKLIVDAGFDHDSLEGSVGVVIRDHNDKFIAVANEKIEICYDAFIAEAIAVRFGLNLGRRVGCSRIEVNSDNVKVISTLNEGYSSSVAGTIFDDSYFLSLDFNHIVF
ncbi:hypothetical protein D1007_13465 [Hordeum vulgare]|nr:hypothetical protein D1007_13465 [Hordeum vulgare]